MNLNQILVAENTAAFPTVPRDAIVLGLSR